MLRAIGMTSGIGSLLVGARQAGFEIVGNVEWRKYYRVTDGHGRNTFTDNFFGSFLVSEVTDQLVREFRDDVDLLMGHPECGAYSVLSGANYKGRTAEEYAKNSSDIPVFVEGVKRLQPKFFVMDNLPRSLIGYPMERWIEMLPEYNLFPEWVSNYHYGNIQKNRKRFFMIGCLKELEDYVFVPGETEQPPMPYALDELLNNIVGLPNQDPHVLDATTSRGRGIVGDRYLTFREAQAYFRGGLGPEGAVPGRNMPYLAKDGTWKQHIGLLKTYHGYCHVLHGGWPTYNPLTCLPFTIRERARIQGIPDDFIFYGTVRNEDGEWNHNKNSAMVKQTGKCMPVQFAKFISSQVSDFLTDGIVYRGTGKRFIRPNKYVDEAKKKFCSTVGYGIIQEKACALCGVAKCPNRKTGG